MADSGQRDWSLLFDPRRDRLTPDKNPWTDLEPHMGWLKDAVAKSKGGDTSVDSYFEPQEVSKTRMASYQESMGKKAADEAHKKIEGAKAQADQAVRQWALQHGVTQLVVDPKTGVYRGYDQNGQPVDVPNPLPAAMGGTVTSHPGPIDAPVGEQPTGGQPQAPTSATAPAAGKQPPVQDRRAEAGDGALSDIAVHLAPYQDTHTQSVLRQLQSALAQKPGAEKQVRLGTPDIGQILGSLVLAIATRKAAPGFAAQVLSLPWMGKAIEQKRLQAAEDQRHAEEFGAWQQDLQFLQSQLGAAERMDTAEWEQKNKATELEATLKEKRLDKNASVAQNEWNKKLASIKDLAVGAGAQWLVPEDQQKMYGLYSEMLNLPDADVSDEGSPKRKALEARYEASVASTELRKAQTANAQFKLFRDTYMFPMDVAGRAAKLWKDDFSAQMAAIDLSYRDEKDRNDVLARQEQIATMKDLRGHRAFEEGHTVTQDEEKSWKDGLDAVDKEGKRLDSEYKGYQARLGQVRDQLYGKGKQPGLMAQLEALRGKANRSEDEELKFRDLDSKVWALSKEELELTQKRMPANRALKAQNDQDQRSFGSSRKQPSPSYTSPRRGAASPLPGDIPAGGGNAPLEVVPPGLPVGRLAPGAKVPKKSKTSSLTVADVV